MIVDTLTGYFLKYYLKIRTWLVSILKLKGESEVFVDMCLLILIFIVPQFFKALFIFSVITTFFWGMFFSLGLVYIVAYVSDNMVILNMVTEIFDDYKKKYEELK